ncbi:MAG: BTAD domain-containing putative transcriptional regulator [Nitrospirota bacterium]|nr:BTAD domain-containing putative transcriptional regulator [Nitrospirota bacterium]
MPDQARQYSDMASSLMPEGEKIPQLHRAADKDPLYEEVYVYLMRSYMETYPSKAVQIFNGAKETLKRELGIEPCPALLSVARKAGILG